MPSAPSWSWRSGPKGSSSGPKGPGVEKLSWEETAREMAGRGEDWSEWDALDGEGLDSVPWEGPKTGRIAERRARYKAGIRPPKTVFRRYEIRWAVLDPSGGRKWPRPVRSSS